jgi:hypothetical protein
MQTAAIFNKRLGLLDGGFTLGIQAPNDSGDRQMCDVITPHPRLPHFVAGDVRVRHVPEGWLIEDAHGRRLYETAASLGEARLIARTVVRQGGRVWVCRRSGWTLIDED